jgi:hypothetical protein
MAGTFLEDCDRLNLVKVIQRLQNRILAEQDPTPEKVREEDLGLVSHMFRCWDGENVVEFLFVYQRWGLGASNITNLEGSLFRFWT